MTQQIPDQDHLDLARRLLAYETHDDHTVESSAIFGVTEKLRRPLSRVAGTAGFRSLLSRALTLASAKAPSLSGVRISSAGSLDNLDTLGDHGQTEEANVMLVAQLLALLGLFIGDSLVLRFLSDIWPDLVVSETVASEHRRI
jgi:hypothetical protein